MIAIVGSDGHRLVVWGLGATEEEAREDAVFWVSEAEVCPRNVSAALVCTMISHDVSAYVADRIRKGETDWPEVRDERRRINDA